MEPSIVQRVSIRKLTRKLIDRINIIRKRDQNINQATNLEFLYCLRQIIPLMKEQKNTGMKTKLENKLNQLELRKKIQKMKVSSLEARYWLYQKLIPRKGRKSKTDLHPFVDLSYSISLTTLYSIFRLREIVISVLSQ